MVALLTAIEAERIFQIKLLLADDSISYDQTDKNGHTALIKACLMKSKWKSLLVSNLLIDKGVDLNKTDIHGRTCLTYSCMAEKESNVKILLDTGDVAPNTRDIYGYTNLMHAVLSGSQSVVTILLVFLRKYGLSLDDRTENGFTTYMLAVKFGYLTIARILDENGASTATFDFEKFRNSEDWGRICCKNQSDFQQYLYKRSKTAPVRLRQESSNDPIWIYQRSVSTRGGVLTSITERKNTVQIYHDLNTKSTTVNDAKKMFKRQQFCDQKLASKPMLDKCNSDFYHGDYKTDSRHRQRDKNKWKDQERYCQDDSTKEHRTSKSMLGVLLNESVLTQIQNDELKQRSDQTKLYKRQLLMNKSRTPSIPSIVEPLPQVSVEDVNGSVFLVQSPSRRCVSSVSNASRKKRHSARRRKSVSQ